MRLTTPTTWMRRGIAAALTAGMVVPVGVAPVIAAVELDLATVYAGAEAIDDGGSDQCERDFTTSAQCSAARSGSRQGASGSGSGAVEAVLDHDGSDLVLIAASGSYGGRATPTEEDGAYGEGSAGLQVRFEVLSPTIARITGSLRTTNNRDVACTQLAMLGPNDAFSAHAPGSRCRPGVTDGYVDHTMTLQPGVWQFGVGGDGGPSQDEGEGSASSRGRFDIDVRLFECSNEFTDGADTIDGTPGDDVLCGGGGNDTITGKGGNDRIFGGAGYDLIHGEDGDDRIEGGDGDDLIGGGPGRDVILGGAGADSIGGAAGRDTIRGGPGNDEIDGFGGADDLYGEGGDDEIEGGYGDDDIDGGSGHDTSGLRGGPGDDLIRGGSGDDLIEGGDDYDTLEGQDGLDKLRGESGDDTLTGGRGRDVLNGGADRDVLRARDTRRDRVLGGPGYDRGRVDSADEVVSVEST